MSTPPPSGRRDRDEERRLANLRRRQRRDREQLDRDDALLPQVDDDSWQVGDGPVVRRVPGPAPVSDLLSGIVADKGWDARLLTTNVLRRWPAIVGAAVAEHTTPVRLAGGILVIAATDHAWVTQVRYLAEAIRDQVNAHLPPEQAVRSVDVVLDRGDGRA